MDAMDDVSMFALQVREAFALCGPVPVFAVVNEDGCFKATRIKRIHTAKVPRIRIQRVKTATLMNSVFQEEINDHLAAKPLCFDGVDDMTFRLTTGKYAVVRNIRWAFEIYRLNRMEMDKQGVVGIMDYEFTQTVGG